MQVWVRFISGGRRGETIALNLPLNGAITIGRAETNVIVLPAGVDVAASSNHAELRNHNEQLVFVDKNSTNGSWVHGQRVTTCSVTNGLQVTFGRGGPEAQLYFQPDAAPVPAPAPAPAPAAAAHAYAQPQAAAASSGGDDGCEICG